MLRFFVALKFASTSGLCAEPSRRCDLSGSPPIVAGGRDQVVAPWHGFNLSSLASTTLSSDVLRQTSFRLPGIAVNAS